jgi:hypothetical protein
MISIPVAIWIALNVMSCAAAALRRAGNKVGFALTLGVAALSCGALSAHAVALWLGLEITLWVAQLSVAVALSIIRPPGHDNSDVARFALAAAIRLGIVMIIWLCL